MAVRPNTLRISGILFVCDIPGDYLHGEKAEHSVFLDIASGSIHKHCTESDFDTVASGGTWCGDRYHDQLYGAVHRACYQYEQADPDAASHGEADSGNGDPADTVCVYRAGSSGMDRDAGCLSAASVCYLRKSHDDWRKTRVEGREIFSSEKAGEIVL